MTQITKWDAFELSEKIHQKEVSCKEVMTAYLGHINKVNPELNAIVSLQDETGLLKEADQKDKELAEGKSQGWMHGFPIAPKDLTNTKGIKTTMASLLFKDNVPTEDGLMASRMRENGAIFIGKTNTPEFGYGSQTYNSVFGATGNAYDPSKTSGGSSGGAAVALATHMMPVADGSDMMGSLRNPAAYNNIFGFRPSQGRVPFYPGADVFCQQLATEGPMGRCVKDVAMLLSVQSGWDPRTPIAIKEDPKIFTQPLDKNLNGVKIGWLGDWGGYLPMEEGVLDICQNGLKVLETLGCQVEETQIPYSPNRMWDIWMALRQYQSVCNFKALADDPEKKKLMKPEAVWEIESGAKLSVEGAGRAMLDRSAMYQAGVEVFKKYDYLVVPTAQCFPFDKTIHWPKTVAGRTMDTYHRWMEVVVFASLMGCPSISVPVGFNEAGLPMGMQIIGRPQADFETLQIAYEYEKATEWTKKHPSPFASK